MSTEYDPRLQALFEQAGKDFDHDAFARGVMRRIDRARRTAMIAWSSVGVVLLVCAAFLAPLLLDALGFVSQFLPVTLVEMEAGLLQQLLSPINSVAAAIAIGALALCRFYRRIFR